MYEQISRNKWKSAALVVFFMAFIFVLTWFFEYVTGWGKGGLVLAVAVAMGMAAVGYYASDKIVLGISRARPVTKDEFPYLYNVVEGLAIAAGVPAPKCYVIDDTAPNAFAAGRKPETAVICVTTGILEKLNRVELEGVIAHEMSHIKNYDVRLQTLVVVMAGIVALLSDWMLRSFMWGGGRRRSRDRGGSGGAEGILVLVGPGPGHPLALHRHDHPAGRLAQARVPGRRELGHADPLPGRPGLGPAQDLGRHRAPRGGQQGHGPPLHRQSPQEPQGRRRRHEQALQHPPAHRGAHRRPREDVSRLRISLLLIKAKAIIL